MDRAYLWDYVHELAMEVKTAYELCSLAPAKHPHMTYVKEIVKLHEMIRVCCHMVQKQINTPLKAHRPERPTITLVGHLNMCEAFSKTAYYRLMLWSPDQGGIAIKLCLCVHNVMPRHFTDLRIASRESRS